MEERATVFTEKGKKDSDWVFVSVLRFAQSQKVRVESGQISPATLRNYIKAIKLFCEMNDISIVWKKITRDAYNLGMSHISSKCFFSDLSNALRKGFHSSFSISSTVLKEDTVLHI